MPVFRFRMQTMLDLKEQLEKNEKNKLAIALNKLKMEQGRLDHFRNEMAGKVDEFMAQQTKGITVSNVQMYNMFLNHLYQKVKRQSEVVNLHTKSADKIRRELLKAVQQRKIYHRLREKKYKEFLKDVDRKQQKVVDELVSYRSAR